MSAIKLNSSGGGSITISPASTASTLTLTAPAQTGTIGLDGPAFSASSTGSQSISNSVYTKLSVTVENFDTASAYDAANSRFLPVLAGYYMLTAAASGIGSTGTNLVEVQIYKNGAASGIIGTYTYNGATAYSSASTNTVGIIYLNGSTDYIEVYGRVVGSGSIVMNNVYLAGVLARGAA